MWSIKIYIDGYMKQIRFFHNEEAARDALFERQESLPGFVKYADFKSIPNGFEYKSGNCEYRNIVDFVSDITELGWL